MSQNAELSQVWIPPEGTPHVGDVLLGAAGAVHGELPELRLRPIGGDRRSKDAPLAGVASLTPQEQLQVVNPSARSAQSRLGLENTPRAVVVLIDGLGWHNLMARADLAPFLTRQMSRMKGQSALPSTTAANITYLGTGVLPGQTAMAGYTVRNPATLEQANLISWNGLPNPLEWQRVPTIFERLAQGGTRSAHVSTWRFERSGLTQAALRGADFSAAEGLAERVDATIAALSEGEHRIAYLYWADVDAKGHQYGWNTTIWDDELRRVDRELERLARELPPGTLLVLTADHGMVDVPSDRSQLFDSPARIDLAEHQDLRQGVNLVAGENRFLHLFTDQAEAVAERWRGFLGQRALVRTRAQACADDAFGPVREDVAEVIGDVTVAVLGDLSLGDSRIMSAGMRGLPGLHGSVTEAERAVPILTLIT